MIQIAFDAHKLQVWFDNIAVKQIPYASARALTDTANDVKEAAKVAAQKHFILRNAWVLKGIRTRRAEKRDWPRLRAEVGSIDWYMQYQEEGGIKRALRKSMGVPIRARATPQTITPRRMWPGALLRKKKLYFVRQNALYMRDGRHLKLMYRFTKEARIKARWGLKEAALSINLSARMNSHFEKRMTEAVNSAK